MELTPCGPPVSPYEALLFCWYFNANGTFVLCVKLIKIGLLANFLMHLLLIYDTIFPIKQVK